MQLPPPPHTHTHTQRKTKSKQNKQTKQQQQQQQKTSKNNNKNNSTVTPALLTCINWNRVPSVPINRAFRPETPKCGSLANNENQDDSGSALFAKTSSIYRIKIKYEP